MPRSSSGPGHRTLTAEIIGSNPLRGANHVHVAQLEERHSAKVEDVGSSPAMNTIWVWESLVNPPDLESGDRRFESDHLDQFNAP